MYLKRCFLASFIVALSVSACSTTIPPHIAAQFATPTATAFPPGSHQIPGKAITPDSQYISNQFEQSTTGNNLINQSLNVPWGKYPAPSLFSDTEIPVPAPAISQADGQVNILIMGSDQRPAEGGFRTDVMLLLTLNSDLGTVNVTSLPRDLYVYQPGYRMDRINSAQARGGFELTASTFEYNFGFRPDHWVLVNFLGFGKIIDSLGGINVNVSQPLSDQREGYGTFYVSPGLTYMDANTALWYVRSRGTTSDFDRTRRQQEVIKALFFDAFSLDFLANSSDIYQAYRETFSTDLDLLEILRLLPLANQIYKNNNINSFSIGPNEVTPWITSAKAQVLLPIQEEISNIFSAALNLH